VEREIVWLRTERKKEKTMRKKLILGGPGAGKTHRLLEILDEELSNGVRSHEVAFVSFTRKAVREAKERAMRKFDLPSSALPFFRTLHSLCYRQLGIRQQQVFAKQHTKEFANILGVKMRGDSSSDIGDEMELGDKMMFLDNLCRCTERTLRETWENSNLADVSWYALERFSRGLHDYKGERGLVDFSDMLTGFVSDGADVGCRVAIIDEAQDLNPIQWRIVATAFQDCDRMYVAGDDDQAIYGWSGADVDQFLALEHFVYEREVLPVSHRLPRRVFNFAAGIANRIQNRYERRWHPRGEDGSVSYCHSPSDVNLSEGTWYLLARNRCFLKTLEHECYHQGVPFTNRWGSSIDESVVRAIKLYERAREGALLSYDDINLVMEKIQTGRSGDWKLFEDVMYSLTDVGVYEPRIWHDEFNGVPLWQRAYYLTALRRGHSLTKPPRVHVDTIHGVKGGEADNVLLMTDQTARTEEGAVKRPDDEARVFYVGATRARKSLRIMTAQTNRGYSL
jgi:superfamily I DNA/RNA helicase